MLNNLSATFIIAAILLVIAGCGGENNNTEKLQGRLLDEINADSLKDTGIELVTGPLRKSIIGGKGIYKTNLKIKPGNSIGITAPMDGFLKDIRIRPGQYVQKGTLLYIMEHPEIYTLQSAFLETKEKIAFYEHELQRKGDLSFDYAASLKSFQQAESDYRAMLALLNGYEKKLEFLGINADSLVKSGMVDDIRIYAPRSGVVISADSETGKYLFIGHRVAEIAQLNELVAECNIGFTGGLNLEDESDLYFTPVSIENMTVPVRFDGKSSILNEDQTIKISFLVNNHENLLYPGMAGWISRSDNPDYAFFVPLESTIRIDEDRFMIILDKNTFKKFKIQPGILTGGLLEIRNADNLPSGAEVVYEGAGLIHSILSDSLRYSAGYED